MSSDRERNEQGRYVETVSSDTVLEVIQHAPDPIVTAKEVGKKLDCTSEAARQKLLRLQDQGTVARRKVGAGAVVWWLVDNDHSTSSTEFDADDSLFTDPATFSSGDSDISRNTDEYLAAAIADDSDPKE